MQHCFWVSFSQHLGRLHSVISPFKCSFSFDCVNRIHRTISQEEMEIYIVTHTYIFMEEDNWLHFIADRGRQIRRRDGKQMKKGNFYSSHIRKKNQKCIKKKSSLLENFLQIVIVTFSNEKIIIHAFSIKINIFSCQNIKTHQPIRKVFFY